MLELKEYRGFWIRPDDPSDLAAVQNLEWDSFTKLLGIDDVVIDAGAHIGTTTKRFADTGATVLAFEPDPDNFRLLQLNVKGLDRVAINECALSDHDGEDELWLSSSSMCHTLQKRWLLGRSSQGTIVVRAALFEEVADLATAIKIDIEGGEYILVDTLCHLPPSVTKIGIEFHRVFDRYPGMLIETLPPPHPLRNMSPELTDTLKIIESLKKQGFEMIEGPRPSANHKLIWQLVAQR